MKTEKEIREKIKDVTESYQHVLDCKLANVTENAPRALMQLQSTSILDALYFVIGEKRPQFKCDKMEVK